MTIEDANNNLTYFNEEIVKATGVPTKYVEPIEFYKCVGDDWALFEKGEIYTIYEIGGYIEKHPEDFKPVLPYPTTRELIETIETGKNKTKVLKALRQWSNSKSK